ncbi:MAG: phage head-tail connector protein [Nitrospirae bacterium]|nr:phage head-tail connector protein [Nitrospirota bacterium]
MKLASLDQLKMMLSISNTDTTQDALLNLFLDMTSGEIENYLNRSLKKMAREEKFDFNTNINEMGTDTIILKAYPVDLTQPFTVQFRQQDSSDVYYDYKINDDFFVLENEGILKFIYHLPSYPPLSIYVNYTGGFDADADDVLDVPTALKSACLMQCRYDYMQRNNIGVTEISFQRELRQITPAYDILPRVKNILDQYRSYAK